MSVAANETVAVDAIALAFFFVLWRAIACRLMATSNVIGSQLSMLLLMHDQDLSLLLCLLCLCFYHFMLLRGHLIIVTEIIIIII